MERYIHDENIRHYHKLLETEQDEHRRSIIRKLLTEEEAKKVPANKFETRINVRGRLS